jgi:hypothetical protein
MAAPVLGPEDFTPAASVTTLLALPNAVQPKTIALSLGWQRPLGTWLPDITNANCHNDWLILPQDGALFAIADARRRSRCAGSTVRCPEGSSHSRFYYLVGGMLCGFVLATPRPGWSADLVMADAPAVHPGSPDPPGGARPQASCRRAKRGACSDCDGDQQGEHDDDRQDEALVPCGGAAATQPGSAP